MRQSFRALASSRDSGEVRETAGVTIASSGVTFQMFNAAFLSSPVVGERDLDSRITTAKVHFAARGLGWSYWVCDRWLTGRLAAAPVKLSANTGFTSLPNSPACWPSG